jgi:hypothetical protein
MSIERLKTVLAAAAVGVAMAAQAASAAPVAFDQSFEFPSMSAGAYEYGVQNGAQHSSNGVNVMVRGLTFGNGAGVQSNGSAWGFAPAPSGRQTAFLQSYANQIPGEITQIVTGLTPGQSYVIAFDAANRPGYDVNPVRVSFDGASLGRFTPASTDWAGFATARFTATSSRGVITFAVPRSAGDADIGIDNIRVSAVSDRSALGR